MEEDFFNNIPKYTHDLFKLEQSPQHLVFDCGPLWYDIPHVCTAWTIEKLSLWEHLVDNGSREAVPLRMDGAPRARVRGTLYAMSPDEIMQLDTQRQNGVSFERKEIFVVVGIKNERGEPARVPKPVWMYQACKDKWADQIRWDQQTNRCGRHMIGHNFQIADTFPDDRKFLHNHFGFTGVMIEDIHMPEIKITQASEEVIRLIGKRNSREIRRIKRTRFFRKFKLL